MQVILLERIENLGQMGDTVAVKNGYARNFLLPQNKALRATKDNVAVFEAQKVQLEASNLQKKQEAEKVAKKMDGTELTLIRQAGETGQLYGSVRTHELREELHTAGFDVEKSQIDLKAPIKNIGLFPVRVKLHPEVDVTIAVNIAKSEGEAKAQRVDESVVQTVEVAAEDAEKLNVQDATVTVKEAEEASPEDIAKKEARAAKKAVKKAAAEEEAEAAAQTSEAENDTPEETPETGEALVENAAEKK